MQYLHKYCQDNTIIQTEQCLLSSLLNALNLKGADGMAKIPEGCPCTQACPDRSPEYCKTCKKGNKYKNNKLKEYDKNKKNFDFMLYQGQQIMRSAKASKDFRKGKLK